MINRKLFVTLLSVALIGAITTSCGKASPQLPSNISNPNSPNYNPNNPNGIYTPVTGMGSVVGRVVDGTGKGLASVTVTVKNITATTTITGDFQLNNVPVGEQVINLRLGNRQLQINVNVVADTAVTPNVNPIQFSNNGTGGSGNANTQLKTFKVDQDLLFNQWQAKSVAVAGGTIYVAVSDIKNIFKKGSIIRMDSESGKTWKNIGSEWLGLKFPIDQTIKGVATNGSNLVAVDSKGALYNVENAKKVKVVKSGPGNDVAVGAGVIYVANGSAVERAESSGEGRTAIPNFSISGGICTDTKGNLFAISGSSVKKIDAGVNSTPMDVVTNAVNGGIDLAVDDKNGFIYVLEQSEVKRFTLEGVLLASFGNGAQKPTSITTDELGNVYVSDEGKDYKESKIIKFAPGSSNIPSYQNQDYLRNMQNNLDGTGESTGYYNSGSMY